MFTTTIDTLRLELRPFQSDDLDQFWKIGPSNYEIACWLTGLTWPPLFEEAKEFIDSARAANQNTDSYPFAIDCNGQLIGCIEVQKAGDLKEFPELPTIGYWLSSAAQGHGYMQEACVAALHWGFARDACNIFAVRVFANNFPSQRTLKRLGFEPVGVCIRYSKPLKQNVENIIMHLPRDRFEALHGDAHVMMGAAQ
ncbi:GNAT family N-acetyltransferase [Pseudovibrio sp. Tun.PSC04-5.I4]|uniref:GNAT family N-acetyltransferase n=1 Tax=Pseudovibrio sp. Tun.PSC04-5.I4 TaxID=1798213 RepID=UPI0008844D27|nr:GNAT family N-acetyltransferase [Pseudovibrio sp. Tun.PSC04-5.I4]SDR22750.1 Protein N-acetyltransferase, RimJ/RimL family [Pseudovibrio sp. Tun.PSC04-5.I4]